MTKHSARILGVRYNHSPVWLTESNAFLKSIYNIRTVVLLVCIMLCQF